MATTLPSKFSVGSAAVSGDRVTGRVTYADDFLVLVNGTRQDTGVLRGTPWTAASVRLRRDPLLGWDSGGVDEERLSEALGRLMSSPGLREA